MKLHSKRKKYVKRVLSALLIFVLSFSVISMVVTVIFFYTAFQRNDMPSEFSYSYTQMADDGYPYQKVTFSSGSNTLTGYYYSNDDDPSALVVIAAGFGDSGAAHLPEMKCFVDNGYGVLCYDATGVGESEGAGRVGLSQPALDLRAALRFTSEDHRLCELPILLYGHSAGGYAAATCMDDSRVKAAVIISAFENPLQLMRESAREYVGVLADIEYPFLWIGNQLFCGSFDRNASECIEEASVPAAIFEGSDDERVPFSQRLSNTLDCTDDGVIDLTVYDEAPRNGHSGIWLSDAALNYRADHSDDSAADPERSNILDQSFMTEILSFYRAAL